VEVAADVVDGEQLREFAGIARLDLPPPLPQLGFDVGEAEQLVDARLVGELVDLLPVDDGDPVLTHREAAGQRPLAELDVVRGGASEVLEQVAEGVLRPDSQIDLEPRMGEDARGGVAATAGLRR
jgi:hypothetical protein